MFKSFFPYLALVVILVFFAIWRKRDLKLALLWVSIGGPVLLASAWLVDAILEPWFDTIFSYGHPVTIVWAFLVWLGLHLIVPCVFPAAAAMAIALTVAVKRSRGWVTAILAFPVIGALIAAGLLAGVRISFNDPANDIRQWQFNRSFAQLPHPAESRLLAARSRIGNLTGMSNHCDFFAGQMRWTSLSSAEVEQFYAGLTIPAANPDQQTLGWPSLTAEIVVAFFSPGETVNRRLPSYFDKAADWGIDPTQYPGGTLYVVYAFDFGYSPGHDMRCH